jgi:uncharacterized membrane protein (DUF485 family)
MGNAQLKHSDASSLDYEKIIETPEFKNLVKSKKRFITPYVIIFFLVYTLMPILTGFSTVLETRVIGWITGTWLYAFGVFIMVWVFSTIYMRKSYEFDADAEEIINKNILK